MDRITVRYNIPAMKTAISFRTFFMEANKDRNQVPFFVITTEIGLISHSFLQLVASKVDFFTNLYSKTPSIHFPDSVASPFL